MSVEMSVTILIIQYVISDPLLAPTPFLAKLIKILNNRVSGSEPPQEVEMVNVDPDTESAPGDITDDGIENLDIN